MLLAPFRALSAVNSVLLAVGRFIAWVCLGVMVLTILVQIVWRYVPGLDALNWTEELARFLMLWMTGLIAPSAYRWGGLVAIDMFPRMLPSVVASVLNLVLLAIALLVLLVGIRLGYGEVTGFGGRFNSPTLKVPLSLVGGDPVPLKKAWMFASLLSCVVLMTLVNIELILRNLIIFIDPAQELPEDRAMIAAGAD